ncbi:MAG: cytidine deaminase [Deltaproteobacteria bacterium]|nr:cytidine deaminase [Deltaproteobacteria bacterium]
MRSGRAASRQAKVDWAALIQGAREVRERAYAPYSRFKVGAAVLGESGRIYVGCNVENSSYGLTVCAERNAAAQAVAAGEKKLLACAIAAGGKPCPPCGMCRQVLAEFGDPAMPVVLLGGGKARIIHALSDLLPHAFDKTFL